MKTVFILFMVTMVTTLAFSQENMMTLSGGYAFSNVEDTDANANGWRINALYEFNPMEGKFAHGLSVGYASVNAEDADLNTYKIGAWPIYYAPKFLFGKEKIKGFIKGAVGWQFSKLRVEGGGIIGGSIEDSDSGFTGGGGAGISYFLNDKIFLSAEYELLWMSNSFYRDETLNTVSLGVGYKF
jgi:opacity protein-like surface antigen